MGDFNDEELIQEFVVESREHLATIEPDLLILEREGSRSDQELINRVFRAIHSIKGAAGFFGFDSLTQLSHVMESLLMLVRDKKISPSPDVVEPLLVAVDKLRAMLDDIHASDKVACQVEIQQLEALVENRPASSQSAAAPYMQDSDIPKGQSFSISPQSRDAIEKAVIHGKRLYALKVDTNKDFISKDRNLFLFIEQAASMGSLLDTAFDTDSMPGLADCLEKPFYITYLYATVLEEDLIEMGLDLPREQIIRLEPKDILGPSSAPSAPIVNKPPVSAAPEEELPPDAEEQAETKAEGNRKTNGHAVEGGETLRIRLDLLNRLMDLAGEMVLSRNQLLRMVEKQLHQGGDFANIIQNINLITTDLQEHIMQTRMQPIGNVFAKFPRVVRDMSRQLGKEIDLQMSGNDVELDKSIIERLSDPLTHLIRNCCDHALEAPEERLQNGKPRTGFIGIQVFHEGGQINIAITDDGRGIDTQKIVEKALQKGLITEADLRKMSHQEMVNLIFLPGLSTAEKVSGLSGRGVGMDVVKTNIEKIGGHIVIETIQGEGTTFLLRLPLTMAIIPSLIVGVAGQRFAMPQINLVELVCVKASDISTRIEKVGNADVLRLREELLPVIRLADVLNIKPLYVDRESHTLKYDRRASVADEREISVPEDSETPASVPVNRRLNWQSNYNILVLKVGTHEFGLIVDELFDTEEIVVKPLPELLKNCKCFAGATILGDGRVSMILDAAGILTYSKLSFAEVNAAGHRRDMEIKATAQSNPEQSFILFNHSPDEVFAFPMASVVRLEKFKIGEIDLVGDREYLAYRDKGLPLVRLSRLLSVRPCPAEMKDAYLIVTRSDNGMAGFIASRIIDIVNTDAEIAEPLVRENGISGSAIVHNHLTTFIDPRALLSRAGITPRKGEG